MSPVVLDEPYLIHSLPGRMRLHLPDRSRVEQRAVEARLRQLPGVLEVRVSPLTGNLLIRFVPTETDERAIMAAVRGADQRRAGSYRFAGTGQGTEAVHGAAPGPARLHAVDLVLQAMSLVVNLLTCESPLVLLLVGAEFLRFAIAVMSHWPAPLAPATAGAQAACTCCPVHGPMRS